MNYAHLSQIPKVLPPAPRWMPLRRLLFGNRLARRIGAQAEALAAMDALEAKTAHSIPMANADLPASEFGSGYGYADDLREVAVAIQYQREIEAGFPDGGDSQGLYTHAQRILSDLIIRQAAPTVVDFGVSYAYVDATLAAAHPSVQFVGVDRSVLTKALNDRAFSALANQRIIAGDIFEVLQHERFDGGILWTMRTLLLLPKPFLARLYRAAAAA